MNQYNMAGIVFEIDCPSTYLHPNFSIFQLQTPSESVDYYWHVRPISDYVPLLETTQILKTDQLQLVQNETHYELYYNTQAHASHLQIEKNGTHAALYYKPFEHEDDAYLYDLFLLELFLGLRDFFCYHMLLSDRLLVHSASLIYKEKAYLFSASSGMGKSTHTNAFSNRFGAPILNGDVCVIYQEDNQVFAASIPWCGSSDLFCNKIVPLGGLIFLARGQSNYMEEVNEFYGIIQLCARLFNPKWTTIETDATLSLCSQLIPNIPYTLFRCLPNEQSLEVSKAWMDS